MQNDLDEQEVGLFGALLGLAVQPWETTQILLSKKRPRFVISFFLILIIVIFGPTFIYMWQVGSSLQLPDRVFNNLSAAMIFLTLYTVCQGVYFFILGFEFTFSQLLATIVYSLTPFISVFLIIYVFNYLAFGNFHFLNYMAYGELRTPVGYAEIMPYLTIIAIISSILIISFSIKVLNDAENISSLLYGIISVAPICIAAFATLFVSDLIRPGSKEGVSKIINYVVSIWSFKAEYF